MKADTIIARMAANWPVYLAGSVGGEGIEDGRDRDVARGRDKKLRNLGLETD